MKINNSKIAQAQDAPGIGNPKIVCKYFTDVDCFKEFFAHQKAEVIQLTSGFFQPEILSIQIGDIYFVYNQANLGLQLCADPINNYINFSIIWSENEKEYSSFRYRIEPERTIFSFNGRGGDFISSHGGALTQILIPIQTFHTYADQLQRHDLDDNFRSKNYVNLLQTGMKEIKDYLKQLIWLAVHQPTWFQNPQIEKLVADDFVPLLISQIPIKLNSKSFLKPSRRAKLIAQAEQKMLAHLETPLTLKQLAENLGCSSRALSFGFKDLFGVSPMRYLKVRRLNAVRQHLKASEPENCTIAILASQFGFYSPCHFTRDYKTMFGELPSETLRGNIKS